MSSFGDPQDNDGIGPGDNLYGPPDPGFTSSYDRPPPRSAPGSRIIAFAYLMALLIGAPLFSYLPSIWLVTVTMFWIGVATLLIYGLFTNARSGRVRSWSFCLVVACAALLPIVFVASAIRFFTGT